MNQIKHDYLIRQRKKQLLDGRLLKQVTVLLPGELWDAAVGYADERKVGFSPFVRELLAEYVAQQQLLEALAEGTDDGS